MLDVPAVIGAGRNERECQDPTLAHAEIRAMGRRYRNGRLAPPTRRS
jgi:tRNA(Arg) A34 adenosine deaminase TadA